MFGSMFVGKGKKKNQSNGTEIPRRLIRWLLISSIMNLLCLLDSGGFAVVPALHVLQDAECGVSI